MATQRKHYVTFYSPGTFVSEETSKLIKSWEPALACALAAKVEERYGAKPYGFQFSTCVVSDPIQDDEGGVLKVEPREVERSGTFYITGELKRYDDVPTDKEHNIMRSNMRGNRWPICIENDNSWRHNGIFLECDVIVDSDGKVVRRGDEPELVEYRRQMNERWDAESAASLAALTRP